MQLQIRRNFMNKIMYSFIIEWFIHWIVSRIREKICDMKPHNTKKQICEYEWLNRIFYENSQTGCKPITKYSLTIRIHHICLNKKSNIHSIGNRLRQHKYYRYDRTRVNASFDVNMHVWKYFWLHSVTFATHIWKCHSLLLFDRYLNHNTESIVVVIKKINFLSASRTLPPPPSPLTELKYASAWMYYHTQIL